MARQVARQAQENRLDVLQQRWERFATVAVAAQQARDQEHLEAAIHSLRLPRREIPRLGGPRLTLPTSER
jgi:hypothetical protein